MELKATPAAEKLLSIRHTGSVTGDLPHFGNYCSRLSEAFTP